MDLVTILATIAALAALVAGIGWWRAAARADGRSLSADAVPVALAVIDGDGRFRLVNAAFEEWAGRPAADLVGRPVDEPGGPLRHASLPAMLAAARSGAPVSFEAPSPVRSPPQGLSVSLRPYRALAGGVLATVEDLADRRRTEQELRNSEATTRAILEAAVDGIVTIDDKGCIETFNVAAERIFGYRADEVAGRNVSMLMPEPYRSAHDQYIRNYLTTGEAKIIGIGREVLGLRKDGSTFPMELAVGESRIAGRRIFAGVVRDITERRRTDERLRQSEERFRLLVEGVRDYAIIPLDRDGRITSWNQGADRVAGWSADEAVGRHFGLFYPPEEVAAGRPQAALETARREGRFEEENWRVRSDGSRLWAHTALAPLDVDAGPSLGFVLITRDITDRRAAEEALRRAKDEAERANLAKSKFLAAASHDLRQPVQALFFFTAALDRKLRGHPARPLLADLERSLESLNMLLDSLLDISKLDAGVVAPKQTTFSVAALLERMESEFAPAARAKGLDFRMVPSTAMIRSDPSLLNRVVMNLVANAVRYTQQGRILIGCRRDGECLRIEVLDTGIGIPPERHEDIFEEFYQVANAERDRNLGLGLGLAIVQRLSRLLGHRVSVRSAAGKGSRFSVLVPLAGHQASRAERRAAQTAQAGSSGLIVIIDDEATVLRGLRLILEEWGFEVLAATSEEEAMSLLEASHRRPNAILADYRLRDGHTGTEAIRHIRELFRAQIPSIIITGDTAPERLREAEASGLSILHKPVQPPQLHLLLNQTMGNA